MPTITYKSGTIVAGTTVYSTSSTFNDDFTRDGTFPTNYEITSAKIEMNFRSIISGQQYLYVRKGSYNGTKMSDKITVKTGSHSYNLKTTKSLYPTSGKLEDVFLTGTSGNVGQLDSGRIVITLTVNDIGGKCSPPTGLKVSKNIATGNITLSWAAGSGGTGNPVTGYYVQYQDSPDGSTWGSWTNLKRVSDASATSTSVSINDTRGFYRRYRVKTECSDSAYHSDYSSASGSVRRNLLPGAPGSLTRSPSIFETGNATLTWSAPAKTSSEIAGYEISHAISSTTTFSSYSVDGTYTGTSRELALPSTTRGWYVGYRIRTKDALGEYSDYKYFSALRKNTLPTDPTNVAISPAVHEDGALTVTWNPSTDETGSISAYYVSYSTDGGTTWSQESVKVSGSPISVSVDRGGTVKARVRAADSYGAYSGYGVSGISRRDTQPTTPGNFAASPATYESGNVSLSWSSSSSSYSTVSKYKISYRTSPDNTTWGQTVDVGETTGTSITSIPVAQRGIYVRYEIVAIDALGVASEKAYATIRVNRAPSAPTNVSASPAIYESGNVSISWTASVDPESSAVTYDIEYAINSGSWTSLVSGISGTSYTTAPTLERGQRIKYRVRAKDSLSAASEWSQSNDVKRRIKPTQPIVVGPVDGSESPDSNPVIAIRIPATSGATSLTAQARVLEDGSAITDWVTIGTVSTSGLVVGNVETLIDGEYTLETRIVDEDGSPSDVVEVDFEVTEVNYNRTISPGDVVCSTTLSHKAEVNQMIDMVSKKRLWYGLDEYECSTEVGLYANWLPQMIEIAESIRDVYDLTGRPCQIPEQTGNYPKAATINAVRTLIKGA